MRIYRFCLCTLLALALLPRLGNAEEANPAWPVETETEQQVQPGVSFILRGESLARSGDPFGAITEYRKAIDAGYSGSDVYRNLSTVLYLAGFLDEATTALEEAVNLFPKEIYPRQELGVLYFAGGKIDKAKEIFMNIAAENPTLANTFYYLGVISYRQENFDEAWLYVRRAQLLGHPGRPLLDKLLEHGNEPLIDQREPLGEALCFRQILLPSFIDAENTLSRIKQGEMFEIQTTLAPTQSTIENGGFVGCLFTDEINPILGAELWPKKAFADPTIVETDRGAHIIQRVQPFDPELWRIQIAALKHPKPILPPAIAQQNLSKEEQERYIVLAGTYNGPVLAASMVSRLRSEKLPAYFYTIPDKNGGLIYQVVAGRYPGPADAKAISDRLNNMEIKNSIVDSAQEKIAHPKEEKKEVATVDLPATNKINNIPAAKPETPQPPPAKPAESAALKKPATHENAAPAKAETAATTKTNHRLAETAEPVQPATSSIALIIEKQKDEPAGKYTLHAGTSDNRTKTEEIITRMREAGLPAFAYLSTTKNGSSVYRLVGGRFDSMKEAKAAHQKLTKLGIKNFIANTK